MVSVRPNMESLWLTAFVFIPNRLPQNIPDVLPERECLPRILPIDFCISRSVTYPCS